jgi:MFS family permease
VSGPLGGLLVDVSPLRDSRHYRRLWTGDLVASAGAQFSTVALPYQVYKETGSSLDVGLLGLAALGPLLAGSLAAGAIADTYDRKKLLIVSQLISTLGCVALLVLTVRGDPPLLSLYVLAALLAGSASIESPVRNAVVPLLVGLERLPAAAALNQIVDQTSQIVGPALAGIAIATLGLSGCYAAAACGFALGVVVVVGLPGMRPVGGSTEPGWRALREGFAWVRRQPVLLSTFAIDLNAMIFGMPRALFPALAATTFKVGPQGLGLMYAAPAAGALLAALGSGWVGGVQRQGMSVIVAVLGWGAAIAVFGLLPGSAFPLALVMLGFAGAADVISAVFRSTILQEATPDGLRGRMSALHIAVVTSGPRIGDAESGIVAALTTVRFAVVSGGVICIAGVAALHIVSPVLAHFRRPTPEMS